MGAFRFFTTRELRAAGETTATIRAAIEAGTRYRVIGGWYADAGTPRAAVLAMRMGGRIGCVSALRLHGVWAPPDAGLHICFPTSASGRRSARYEQGVHVVRHWHGKSDRTGSAYAVAPIELALEKALECQPDDYLVAIMDSILHNRLMTRNRLESVLFRAPERVRHLVHHLDARSESGTESIVRHRLIAQGIAVRIQVPLRERDRLDLEIDGWLGVEIDGRAYHAQRDAFTKDRRRVNRIMRGGRLVLQFSYAAVIYDWEWVVSTIRVVMAQHAPVARYRKSTAAGHSQSGRTRSNDLSC